MGTETSADPIDAFNAAHPPRIAPPVEPIRFTGGPAPADLRTFATARPITFRGTYSPRTGHARRWTRENRNPR